MLCHLYMQSNLGQSFRGSASVGGPYIGKSYCVLKIEWYEGCMWILLLDYCMVR